MQRWMRYVGPAILVIVGILLLFVDVDFPVVDPQVLAVVLILAGLVWGTLEFLRQVRAPGNAEEREEEERREDR